MLLSNTIQKPGFHYGPFIRLGAHCSRIFEFHKLSESWPRCQAIQFHFDSPYDLNCWYWLDFELRHVFICFVTKSPDSCRVHHFHGYVMTQQSSYRFCGQWQLSADVKFSRGLFQEFNFTPTKQGLHDSINPWFVFWADFGLRFVALRDLTAS